MNKRTKISLVYALAFIPLLILGTLFVVRSCEDDKQPTHKRVDDDMDAGVKKKSDDGDDLNLWFFF